VVLLILVVAAVILVAVVYKHQVDQGQMFRLGLIILWLQTMSTPTWWVE
jgi:hypothetical protein